MPNMHLGLIRAFTFIVNMKYPMYEYSDDYNMKTLSLFVNVCYDGFIFQGVTERYGIVVS